MSRTDEVVDGIRRMILDGVLAPGARLPVEKELAAALGVSRGSLREGVRALSLLGVLDTRQGDGTYVTTLAPASLLTPIGLAIDLQQEPANASVHAVRRVLETEAAMLAATRITPEGVDQAAAALHAAHEAMGRSPLDHELLMECDLVFHRVIATSTGNPVLAALIEALSGRTVRGRLWRGLSQEGVHQRTHAEHEAILAALAARDPERARLRMAVHLLAVEEYLESTSPEGGSPRAVHDPTDEVEVDE